MKTFYELTSCFFLLLSFLSPLSVQAMENPTQDLSCMNDDLCQAFENILTGTPALGQAERTLLKQLILTASYSNLPMMTEDDFERFLKNYSFIMRAPEEVRAWYLKHLKPYLDDDDVLLIEVKRTAPETLLMFQSYAQYFTTKIYPALVIPVVEYSFFLQLQNAWEKGNDGHEIIARWLQIHTLAYMRLFPREPIDRFIGDFGIFTMPFRQLSYEQLQGMGELYKEAFKEMLGWFYKR